MATHPAQPSQPAGDAASVEVQRTQVGPAGARSARDWVAAEEPLEIQVGSASLAVVMRTPGHDFDLVSGFLVTERVVETPADIGRMHHCSHVSNPEAESNVVRVLLRPGIRLDLERLRRNLYASSSCGVCGKASIESAMATAPPLVDAMRVTPADLIAGVQVLQAKQPGFALTGGLHAAALFDQGGHCRFVREDVGRHNAVDKVIGAALRAGSTDLAGHRLLVSGRISFEIVQKALAARIPLVAAVSAPSSLAVQLAEAAGVTLVAFLRGSRFSVYGRRDRVQESS
ncbi:MAG: formate dehydrogenase accessory sulfurtransferase FdhD [Proteobacteria bacterium]|nr:formate dehydrogenase accessory sulfurtransferase FdhD [Pseudomonadota bacterium]